MRTRMVVPVGVGVGVGVLLLRVGAEQGLPSRAWGLYGAGCDTLCLRLWEQSRGGGRDDVSGISGGRGGWDRQRGEGRSS